MKIKWELADKTVIEGNFPAFGKNTILVDGVEIPAEVNLGKKGDVAFGLGKSRDAVMTVKTSYFQGPSLELRVNGQLMTASTKETVKCPACSKVVIPNDRFCLSCGAELPTAEHYDRLKRVGDATSAIRILAWLFLISGVVMFFISQSQADETLKKLSSLAADAIIPGAGGGVSYSVAELRAQAAWEPWGVLIINAILAAVMAILSFWGRKSPLSAVIIATGTYVVVTVLSAIADPASLAQGMYIKIFIVAILVNGVRSALELRALNSHGIVGRSRDNLSKP
jgi:hypothetical protein